MQISYSSESYCQQITTEKHLINHGLTLIEEDFKKTSFTTDKHGWTRIIKDSKVIFSTGLVLSVFIGVHPW